MISSSIQRIRISSTMHFVVLIYKFMVNHDFLGSIPQQTPWYNTAKFRGIIPCFFSPCMITILCLYQFGI